MILLSGEEERTKQWWPRGLVRGMESHQIARSASAKENTVERRGGVIREDEKRTAGGLHWCRWRVKEMTEKGGETSLAPASVARRMTALIGAGSGRVMTRKRTGGGQRCTRTGVVGWHRRLAAARVAGGRHDEQQERVGGGGGLSDDVGSNVVALGGRQPTTRGKQAMDGATPRRGGADTNGKQRERASDDGAV